MNFKKIDLSNSQTYLLFILITLGTTLFYLGYRYIGALNQEEQVVPQPTSKPVVLKVNPDYDEQDSLLEIKLSRDRERSQEIARIQELLERVGLSDQVRKEAEQELWRLTLATSKETELESLLKANGYQEVLVNISRKLITIVLPQKLQAEQVRVIGQVTAEVTGYSLDQIQIVENYQR